MSKTNAKDRITRYLTKADITLNSEEEQLLNRWENVDHLLRCKTEYNDIILKHTAKFSVSKFTADLDITNAQEIFARSRKLNKRYLAHLHLEDIQQDLKKIRTKITNARIIDAKELAALSRLHDSYTRQLAALPDDQQIVDVPKPVIVFELAGISNQPLSIDIGAALIKADKYLNKLPAEDISFENISDDDATEE